MHYGHSKVVSEVSKPGGNTLETQNKRKEIDHD
jgi:hypothetical protein